MKTDKTQKDEVEQELVLNAASRSLLKSVSTWSKVLAVVGFLVVCGRLFFTLKQGVWSPDDARGAAWAAGRFALDAVYFCIAVCLLLFSTRIDKAFHQNSQLLLTSALSSLKLLFKVAGILAVVITVSFILWQLFVESSF
ncbi:hypothetical protein [Pontibacter actiniarum]|uniref:Uncharacterized protein n=1 Tax=Pontibacter actiniarum TaxID=323450 RepID=A0A1X9YVH4_9BACT|nr:hypothetical protein [Pontibacter actiniarum]ARS36888.1 hypothetical protein CA264_16465 [Pontibacter actiniarum]